MVRLWLALAFLTIYSSIQSQDIASYNKALIWRGIEHSWTYNHRINRLGNYVSYDNGEGFCVHASASGLGSDSTFSTTHYTYVESPDIFFKETKIKITVNGHEGDLLTKVKNVKIDLENWMKDKKHYQVIVNGFEVKSVRRKADQLQLLKFLIEDPTYLNTTQQLQLSAHFNLVTNCRTIECELFNNKTAYDLVLHLLVIAYDDHEKVSFVNSYATRNYVWDRKIEVEDQNKDLAIKGREKTFPHGFLGIKGLGIVLNEEHWLLEYDNFINPTNYDQKTGIMETQINMKFQGWKKGMPILSSEKFKAKFPKKKRGYALLDCYVNLIQVKDAKIKHGEKSCSLYWGGRNKDSESQEAIGTVNISEDLKFQ